MSKIKFARHPRSIVRKRPDYPTSLFATIPGKIVKQWALQPGDLIEFIFATEGDTAYVKIKKVTS